MACLILRAYLKTTYRGVLEFLSCSPALRQELGLHDKLPHYTTLQKFSSRSKVLEMADAIIRRIGPSAGEPTYGEGAAAMDASGLETTTASAHCQCRRGGQRRKWVKISTLVLCGSLLPLGLVLDWGPNNDKCQARALIAKASQATLSEAAKVWAALGGGEVLQRTQTHDGLNAYFTQTRTIVGRKLLCGSWPTHCALRRESMHPRCFQQSKVISQKGWLEPHFTRRDPHCFIHKTLEFIG